MSAADRRVFRIPFSKRALRADVDAELRFHIEGRVEELMSKGLSREQAEREARRRFGDIHGIEREVESIDLTTMRRRSLAEHVAAILGDARYAVRGIARRPVYAAIVIMTLALGIGANTAIFSLVNAVLMRPLPTPGLDRLVVIREDIRGLNLLNAELSPGEALDLFSRKDLFVAAGAHTGGSANLTGEGDPQRVAVVRTLGNFFGVLGARPYLGQLYRPETSTEIGTRAVVVSHGFWQQVLGSDPHVIGHSVQLDGVAFEIVGVLSPDFQYPRTAQLYTPFLLTPQWLTPQRRNSLSMTVIARPRDGLSPEQLATALRLEVVRWHDRFSGYQISGDASGQFILHATPFVSYLAGDLRPVLLALMGAVALVLLIACANVGSLQLVLAARRAKEIAVRAALGAGRSTIVRWLLVESVLLALAGGVLGVGIGVLMLRMVTRLNASKYQALSAVHLDGRVLLFTAAIVVFSALLFGVLPALRAARVDLQEALKHSSRGSSMTLGRHRLLQSSVVVQVALTLMLLLASALTVRSLTRVLDLDPGFHPAHVTTMQLTLPQARYATNAARIAFYNALIERLRSIPGVQSAGIASYLPFNGGTDSSPFELPDRPAGPNEPARHANTEIVAGDYFQAMGIPLLRGRTFSAADAQGTEGVIVDEFLARSFFGNEDPIGKPIIHNNRATIIGVVGNVTQEYLGQAPHPTVYHYYSQSPWISFTTAVVRSSLPDEQVAALARAAVHDVDPQLPVFDVKSMSERISASLTPRRLSMFVLLGFAVLSLALSVIGIYGVMSYSTAQRTQEIGIRMALGASATDVTRMVLGGAMKLATIGVVVGALLFLAASHIVALLLYGVGPRDPVTIAGGIILLGGVALLASYVPARRAARLDPLASLRSE